MLLPYLMGLATVFSAVLPAALALLLLVRMEQAFGFQALRNDWIRGHVVEQLSRLRRGLAPLLTGSPAFVAVQVRVTFRPLSTYHNCFLQFALVTHTSQNPSGASDAAAVRRLRGVRRPSG
jgi:hypothetical protein